MLSGSAAGTGRRDWRFLPRVAVSWSGEDVEQGVREGAQHLNERGHGGELTRSSAEFARSPCGMASPGLDTSPEGT